METPTSDRCLSPRRVRRHNLLRMFILRRIVEQGTRIFAEGYGEFGSGSKVPFMKRYSGGDSEEGSLFP